jgi:hypothetical protein
MLSILPWVFPSSHSFQFLSEDFFGHLIVLHSIPVTQPCPEAAVVKESKFLRLARESLGTLVAGSFTRNWVFNYGYSPTTSEP